MGTLERNAPSIQRDETSCSRQRRPRCPTPWRRRAPRSADVLHRVFLDTGIYSYVPNRQTPPPRPRTHPTTPRNPAHLPRQPLSKHPPLPALSHRLRLRVRIIPAIPRTNTQADTLPRQPLSKHPLLLQATDSVAP